jgi:hypothetical protein
MGRVLEWVVPFMILASTAVITLWMVGAIYFDVCRETKWGRFLAAGWAIGLIVMFAAWQPLSEKRPLLDRALLMRMISDGLRPATSISFWPGR